MKRYFNRFKKTFTKPVSPQDIRGFKIIIGHITNKNSILLADPILGEYIIRNKSTHYDLIITSRTIELVNTKDVIIIEVCEEVKNRVISRVRQIISKDRQNLKNIILGRKHNILYKILTNIIK